MRIVSGIYGGRRLNVPKGRDIRPTSDKIRGAIFNALQARDAVDGAQVIDCFCGTGALGLEALSRGAGFCTFVDSARVSLDLAKENARMLGAGNTAFLLKDATKLAVRSADVAPATLVFLDPPYRKNLVLPALEALVRGGWLAAGALCVIEAEKDWDEGFPEGFEELSVKIYGETKVSIWLHQLSSRA